MNVTDIQFIDDVNFDDSREAVLFYAQIGKRKLNVDSAKSQLMITIKLLTQKKMQ